MLVTKMIVGKEIEITERTVHIARFSFPLEFITNKNSYLLKN